MEDTSETLALAGIKSSAEGKWIRYFEDGRISEVNNYENNMLSGEQLAYHTNGQLALKGSCKNDLRHGTYTYYGTKGQLLQITEFENDVVVNDKVYEKSEPLYKE